MARAPAPLGVDAAVLGAAQRPEGVVLHLDGTAVPLPAMVVARTDAMTRVALGHSLGIRAVRAVALKVMPRILAVRRGLERGLAGLDYPAIAAPV